jgi:dethiobiotin synthetase
MLCNRVLIVLFITGINDISRVINPQLYYKMLYTIGFKVPKSLAPAKTKKNKDKKDVKCLANARKRHSKISIFQSYTFQKPVSEM